MKFKIGPENLKTDFEFSIYKKVAGKDFIGGHRANIKNIGVYLSGGLDSCTLLCLILTELRQLGKLNDIPVTCFTIIKNDGCTYYADRLVKKVIEKFNISIDHVTNIFNPEALLLPSVASDPVFEAVKYNYPNTVFYFASNRPPTSNVVKLNNPIVLTNISESFNRDNLMVSPFADLHKPQILDLLYQLNCDDLIPYTHSCVMMPVGTCNNCFSCDERAWGFAQLGKIDPGTINPNIEDITYNGTWEFKA
jgi:predicted metal-binding protein